MRVTEETKKYWRSYEASSAEAELFRRAFLMIIELSERADLLERRMPDSDYLCPACGSVLMVSRGKLKCTNPICHYQETCADGACGCGSKGGKCSDSGTDNPDN